MKVLSSPIVPILLALSNLLKVIRDHLRKGNRNEKKEQ
jgi:hypothetical protein